MQDISPYFIFCLCYSLSTVLFTGRFLMLYLHHCRRTHSKLSRQHYYRITTLFSAILSILVSALNVVLSNRLEWDTMGGPMYESLFRFLISLFAQTSYLCYTLILLYRLDRIQTASFRSCTRHVRVLSMMASCMAVVCFFTNMILVLLGHSSRTMWVLLMGGIMTTLTSVQLLVVEIVANVRLIRFTCSSSTTSPLAHRIERSLWGWLSLLILSDIIIIVLYSLANATRLLPTYETNLICVTWLCIHLILAFKLLDKIKQGLDCMKESRHALQAGSMPWNAASHTDIVQSGLLSATSTVDCLASTMKSH